MPEMLSTGQTIRRSYMKVLVLVGALLSFNAFADSFGFECTGTDLVYMNSFSMKGMVDTSDDTISYSVETRTAGNSGVVETRTDVVRQNAKFERIDTGRTVAYRAYSIDQSDDHVYVNILMDYPGQLTSQIRNAEGRIFKSSCKSL